MNNKKVISLIVLSVILVSFLAVNVSAIKFWTETSEYGKVYLEITPNSIFNSPFAAYFVQSTVYAGEQADITDVWTNNIANCANNPPYSWKINIFKSGVNKGDFGEMADYADEYETCSWLVTASFVTTNIGEYTLSSKIKATSSSSYQTFPGSNTLTIIDNPLGTPCGYGGWQEYVLITGGQIDWNPYKDFNTGDSNNCNDKDDIFKTSCNSGYHIRGGTTSDTWVEGISDCVINSAGGDESTCKASGESCIPLLGQCCSGLSCGLNFKCSGSATNVCTPACTTGQTCSNGQCITDGDGGTGKTITLTEFYSIADEDFIDYANGCNVDSDCQSLEGYKVSCLKEGSMYTQMQKRIYTYYQKQCSSATPSLVKIVLGVAHFFSLNAIPTSSQLCESFVGIKVAVIEWWNNTFKSGTGICLAKGTSWYSSIWEQALILVGGFGLPYQYVMIITLAFLIIIAMFIINMLK